MLKKYDLGDRVKVSSRGHRKDGEVGAVVYTYEESMWGTIGVESPGDTRRGYGFMPHELSLVKLKVKGWKK